MAKNEKAVSIDLWRDHRKSRRPPELILQQVIRDMRDKVPEMNNNVAQVMANEKLLARNVEQQSTKINELDNKVKAAINLGEMT
jgi:phage shock protein A